MKTLYFIIIVLFFVQISHAQQQSAEIHVQDFRVDKENNNFSDMSSFKIQFNVSILQNTTEYNEKFIMLFFVGKINHRLELLKVYNYDRYDNFYLIRNRNRQEFNLTLLSKANIERDYIVYPVLVKVKDLNLLARRLELVNLEFYDINEILNVLYKSQIIPLTYTEIK